MWHNLRVSLAGRILCTLIKAFLFFFPFVPISLVYLVSLTHMDYHFLKFSLLPLCLTHRLPQSPTCNEFSVCFPFRLLLCITRYGKAPACGRRFYLERSLASSQRNFRMH